jgi:hypothetical protein
MALLTPQAVGLNSQWTPGAAAASNTAVPDDRAWFEVIVGATATTLTLVVPGSVYGVARGDVVASSVSNTTRTFGPLVADLADPTTGLCELTTSQQTNVTISLRRV